MSAGPTSAGFRAEEGWLNVELPSCIRSVDIPRQDDVVTLYRVLRHYHLEETRERSTEQQVRGTPDPIVRVDAPALQWIECALELLDDYAERGLLRYEHHVLQRFPKGRIDWRATIRRDLPCLTDDSVLYLVPFRRVVEAQQHHPLTRLHEHTIFDIGRIFGAGLHLEQSGRRVRPINRREAMTTLIREGNRVFRDRDRRVVRLLERYWMDADLRRREGFRGDLLWTNQFEFVWERMAERVIGGRRKSRIRLPGGHYLEGGAEQRGLHLRPDLIVDVPPNSRIVFDAKYYSSGKLPRRGDILKQLAYAYFSSSKWDPIQPQHVFNIFLLPSDSPPKVVHLSGRHRLVDLTPQQRSSPLAGDIWLFRIDYRELAKAYLSGSRWDHRLFLDEIATVNS